MNRFFKKTIYIISRILISLAVADLLFFPPAGAFAINISDSPMETLVLSPPPNIMFVYDNSGSMDWEFMIQGAGQGCFYPGGSTDYEYLYDLSDNTYQSGSNSDVLSGANRGYWKAQWSDYNKIYYNPFMEYRPWPGHSHANTLTPRSDPVQSTPTLDLSGVYLSMAVGSPEIIVDNLDSAPGFTTTGTWYESGLLPEWDGSAFYANNPPGDTATFTPDLPISDQYEVYAWWNCYVDRDTNAQITISYDGGTDILYKNQRADQNDTPKPGVCGEWILLGQYSFAQGSSGSVTIARHAGSTGGSTIADAVKFVPQNLNCAGVQISNAHYYAWDDADNSTTVSNGEIYLVNFNFASGNATREYYRFYDLNSNDRVDQCELTLEASPPASIRPAIYDDDGNFLAFKTDAEDLQNLANWFSFYRRRELTAKAAVGMAVNELEGVKVGLYSLHRTNTDGGAKQPVLPVKLGTNAIIVDNKDSGFTKSSGWYESGSPNEWMNSSLYTTSIGKTATWTPNLPSAGEYTVYGWWNCYNNRDQNAKYTINHAGGTATVYRNQRYESGNVCGDWVELGTWNFNAGTSGSVTVARHSGSTGSSTNADAVKFEMTSGTFFTDSSPELLNILYNIYSDGGTPLRISLRDVGRYFHQNDGQTGNLGTSPLLPVDEGGMCQQNFAILMTDGYWNGSDPGIGNADGNDGSPFADSYSNTLADVARYYYENDLSSGLANEVPPNSCDPARWQHMVTYGLSFGLEGELNPGYRSYHECMLDVINGDPNAPPAPVWPDPTTNCYECPKKIDDLWHASVNGRGAFYNASNPEELIDALDAIVENISGRKASGASVTVNGEELGTDSVLYQATYTSDEWRGDVAAYPIDADTGEIQRQEGQILWKASDKLQDQHWDTGRRIVTYNGENGGGIPFRYTSLTTAQQIALDSNSTIAQNMVNYLRGQEISGFRPRTKKLGDIVHSSPFLAGDSLYVGGNDGMLHCFNATTGEERFAYVPDLVFHNLRELTQLNYDSNHKFFVDLTPSYGRVGQAGSKINILAGGLGKGGKGIYALDITGADNVTSSSTETNISDFVMWEYPDLRLQTDSIDNDGDNATDESGETDPDMGFSFSRPVIAKSYSTSHSWVVITGNGYSSENGSAVLHILDAITGEVVRKIDTDACCGNGISSPAVIDVDDDLTTDYAYAGDLQGNLWKFDLRDPNPDNWTVAFFDDNGTPMPLFKTPPGQPITTKPDVMRNCKEHGYIVVVGTGKYLHNDDRSDNSTQAVYGIWDYGDDSDNSEYLGTFNPSDGTMSNLPSSIKLKEQTVLSEMTYLDHFLRFLHEFSPEEIAKFWRIKPDTNGNGIHPDPDDSNSTYVGWYFELPHSGERIIKDPIIRDGKAIFLSFEPEISPCAGGGNSILHEIDACYGSRLSNAVFDINDDGQIDENDKVGGIPPSGISFPGMLHSPVFLRMPDGTREMKIFSTSAGTVETIFEPAERIGLYYWREW